MSIAPPTMDVAAPDWSSITETIRCPLCAYDLRGLIEPRCPECGYQFAWPDVLDERRRRHPYLFEHHPQRNLWSFIRTKLGGFLPWRFWRTLRPSTAVMPRRLIVYWLLSASMLTLLIIVGFAQYWAELAPGLSASRQWAETSFGPTGYNSKHTPAIKAQFGSMQNFLDTQFPNPYTPIGIWVMIKRYCVEPDRVGPRHVGPAVAIFLLGPWLNFAVLSVFRMTMRRANINSIHVIRCVIYSDSPLLTAGLFLLLVPMNLSWVAWNYWPLEKFLALIALPCAIASGLTLYKLGFAYQLYLRFPHAWGTAIISQIVAMLSVISITAALLLWS